MGSTFVSFNKLKSDSKKLFTNTKPEAVFLQFVPGQVIDVVTSSEHAMYSNKNRNINSIIARPHYGYKWKRTSVLDEEDRYFPMFRGMVDVPMKGDPVLLCTVGSVQYYLGPLNTLNRPDWNIDHLNMSDVRVAVQSFGEEKIKDRDLLKISKNFELTGTSRLQKDYKRTLDDPNFEKTAIKDIHGDLVFEGRHGNSVRIGSRHLNPYIFISNARNFTNPVEGISDGSLISMTETGTLQQHFGGYEDSETQEPQPGFILADSTTKNPTRTSSQLVSFVNPKVDNPIYSYGNNQMLFHSDRIIFNSRKDDMFMSSFKNIHIGSGNHLTLSVQNDMIIESGNIYLGKQAKTERDNGNISEPLVLGEQLRLILEEMVGILEVFKVTGVQAGISGTASPDIVEKLSSLKQKISQNKTTFLSQHHYIESNDKK